MQLAPPSLQLFPPSLQMAPPSLQMAPPSLFLACIASSLSSSLMFSSETYFTYLAAVPPPYPPLHPPPPAEAKRSSRTFPQALVQFIQSAKWCLNCSSGEPLLGNLADWHPISHRCCHLVKYVGVFLSPGLPVRDHSPFLIGLVSGKKRMNKIIIKF